MSRHLPHFAVVALLTFALAPTAQGGPDCEERSSGTGSTRTTAQACAGYGTLTQIHGSLGSPLRGGGSTNFEDMYLIQITDPVGFTARTDGTGSAEFDSQIWLFRLGNKLNPTDAFGLLGADEIFGGPAGPTRLQPPATDGTGQTIPAAGYYLLAISSFDRDPVSAGGAIFNQAVRTEISGPDGGGGGQAHTGWTGSASQQGEYFIRVTGAAFVHPAYVPAVTPFGYVALGLLVVAAGVLVFRRGRAVTPA